MVFLTIKILLLILFKDILYYTTNYFRYRVSQMISFVIIKFYKTRVILLEKFRNCIAHPDEKLLSILDGLRFLILVNFFTHIVCHENQRVLCDFVHLRIGRVIRFQQKVAYIFYQSLLLVDQVY